MNFSDNNNKKKKKTFLIGNSLPPKTIKRHWTAKKNLRKPRVRGPLTFPYFVRLACNDEPEKARLSYKPTVCKFLFIIYFHNMYLLYIYSLHPEMPDSVISELRKKMFKQNNYVLIISDAFCISYNFLSALPLVLCMPQLRIRSQGHGPLRFYCSCDGAFHESQDSYASGKLYIFSRSCNCQGIL